ncbi:hypothetical protein [Psychromonas aquimarina]|nr:hypothetical protein [Psychromonas aquimarina]
MDQQNKRPCFLLGLALSFSGAVDTDDFDNLRATKEPLASFINKDF